MEQAIFKSCRFRAACAVVLFSLTFGATAQYKTPSLYRQIERAHGIPPSLLYAIALTETGTTLDNGQFVPWPWTLNVEGEPRFFHTKAQAYRNLIEMRRSGLRSIDIGISQVNWRWNGEKFQSLKDALDPKNNLNVAASILRTCYVKTGKWSTAIGCYHSPGNKQRAQSYTLRVLEHWEKTQ